MPAALQAAKTRVTLLPEYAPATAAAGWLRVRRWRHIKAGSHASVPQNELTKHSMQGCALATTSSATKAKTKAARMVG